MSENSTSSSLFGKTKEGLDAQLFTLRNTNGMEVKITNFGSIIVSILTKDKLDEFGDIVLGYDCLTDYLENPTFFGCITGRYANRIANGQFSIKEATFSLARNNGPNHLHGGINAFHKKLWEAETFKEAGKVGVKLSYTSMDGEEGYPGNLDCSVTYFLNNEDALVVDYEAVTDESTVVNLTNHSYFNLKDGGRTSAMEHELKLYADHFTPVDSTLIPTGILQAVAGTPFDFSNKKPIGRDIEMEDDQLSLGGGYDHNFVINNSNELLKLTAEVTEPISGRVMKVWTTEPGVQLYTPNFSDDNLIGKEGICYRKRAAFCLETQHFPDSPNQPNFPTTLLRKGEIYKSQTIYKFGVKN